MRPYDHGRYLVGPEDTPREVYLFPNVGKTVTLVANTDADNVPVALTAGEAREMARLLIEAADEVERDEAIGRMAGGFVRRCRPSRAAQSRRATNAGGGSLA